MSVTWHPAAQEEFIDAARYYDGRRVGLGADFLDAVETAVARAEAHPNRYAKVERDVRRCPVRRFPYSIYFRQVMDGIRVLAVAHHSRAPGYWHGRK